VAASWALAYPLLMVGMAREVIKELEIGWKMIWNQTRAPVLATIVMAAVVIALQLTLDHEMARSLTRLILASCAGALTYAIVIYRLGHQIVEEVREVMIWAFRPNRALTIEK